MGRLSGAPISALRRDNFKIVSMKKEFLEAFSIVVRDQIIMKNSVEISGLGTFKAVHHSQHQEKRVDGKTVMMPPRDTIEFVAEMER